LARDVRKSLIEQLQVARGNRLLISYVTSTRLGYEIQIADDAFRRIYDHLEAGKSLAVNGIDLFIHSNGGSGTVPWRLVSLIRQYTKHFAVLVPHHAFSAATLIALGADEIVMHKMGCLGPIDPSVTNVFNPPHPTIQGQLAPISVEDVTAYFRLVRDEVGIQHEDELVQALTALTDKVHPLAIGNVQRSHNQSRMMARKLLSLHKAAGQDHEMEKLIDTLKSNLFYHGHPINREEAKVDLKLDVTIPSEDIESLMWQLYTEYETEMKIKEPFNLTREIDSKAPPPAPAPPLTTQEIVTQMQQLAQRGIGLPGVTEQQLVALAAAIVPYTRGTAMPSGKVQLDPILGACIESVAYADMFKTDLRVEKTTVASQSGPQDAIKQEILWQRWEKEQ
jgi:Serine dehydrogenase proteinase